MKKTIIVLALIVVVVIAATPFVGGVIMERTVYRLVDDFNSIAADHPAGYSYEIVSYDRGYSSTDFEWKINLGALTDIYGIESIVVSEHARHGYSGVVSTISLEKNAWFNAFIDDTLQGVNPLHVQTCYRFLGGIESTVACDPFSIDVDGETLDVKQGEIKISTNRALKHFSSSGYLGGMAVGENVSIGELSIASNLEKISTYIWDGEVVFGIKDIKARDKNEEAELNDVKAVYGLEADMDANTIDYNMLFTLDSFQVEDQKISDGSIRFSVNGVDMAAYEEFMKTYLRAYSQVMSGIGPGNMNRQQNEDVIRKEMAQLQLQMMGAYEKFLQKGLEIRISDLHLKHPAGEVDGEITLRLLKDMTFAQFAPVLYQPQSLLDIFHLESDIRLPAQLVGENPRLLTPLFPGMQTGLFVEDGDMLVHRAETKDGTLLLNGKELYLGE